MKGTAKEIEGGLAQKINIKMLYSNLKQKKITTENKQNYYMVIRGNNVQLHKVYKKKTVHRVRMFKRQSSGELSLY